MRHDRTGLSLIMKKNVILYGSLTVLTLLVMLLCVCLGSVAIPLSTTLRVLWLALTGQAIPDGMYGGILLSIRLPRILCVALEGASLSLCGAAMQGLLRNPLADGSTLGVSSGASLGAAVAILTGFTLPGFALGGTTVLAIGFAFGAMAAIMSLSLAIDRGLATNTIILMGTVFSMLVTAVLSLLIVCAGEKMKTITYWTMGALSGAGYPAAALLACSLAVCGAVLMSQRNALNALAMGESQALHLGVNVRRVKLTIMAAVSVLIGVCVSVGGGIGFVGLVTPHVVRRLLGPDHRRLLPAAVFGGAIFLLLCDMVSRTIFSPNELPVGVVTSIIGACVFVVIFARTGRSGR